MTFAGIFGAIGKFFASLPGWVWWVVLAVLAGEWIDMRARGDERAKAKLARKEQETSQRQEASERVDAFNEAARAVERLPELELRERTETDPNNRGRVHRD